MVTLGSSEGLENRKNLAIFFETSPYSACIYPEPTILKLQFLYFIGIGIVPLDITAKLNP